MSFMNEFLKRNWDTMKSFLSAVSSPGSAMHLAAYDDSIDLALELSILHSLLCNIFSTLEEVLELLLSLCAFVCACVRLPLSGKMLNVLL